MPPIARKPPTPTRVDDVDTSVGRGRCHIFAVPTGVPRASLLVGHSSTGIASPDLITLAAGLPPFGIEVVLLEQPWSVAGEAAAPPITQLDQAWLEMVADLRRSGVGLRRLAVGGRGVGARVACRTAPQVSPSSVLCLAFPWHPPGRPERSRSGEVAPLAHAGGPVLLVQGGSDPFGQPPEGIRGENSVTTAVIAGSDHGLTRSPEQVAEAVASWLSGRLPGPADHDS